MADIGQLQAKLELDSQGFEKNVKKAKTDMDKFLNGMKLGGVDIRQMQKDLKGLDGALGVLGLGVAAGGPMAIAGLGTAIVGIGVAFAGVGVASTLAAGKIESFRTQFQVLNQSVEKGNALFEEMRKYANVTPFTTSDLAGVGALLQGFQISAEELMPTMAMLGDLSRGNTEIFKGLSLAFGQVSAKGRLMGEEVLQFAERGIPVLETLAQSLGISTAEVSKLIEEGGVSFEMFRSALASLVVDGGQFEGMMQKMSQTFEGASSTLEDSFQTALADLGEGTLPLVVNAIMNLSNAINSVNFQLVGQDIAELVGYFGQGAQAIMGMVDSMGFLSGAFSNLDIFGRYMKDGTQIAKDNELQMEKNRLQQLQWASGGVQGATKVNKAMSDLGGKLADIDKQLAKQNEDYLDTLKSIEQKKLDSISSLENQLSKEEQAFTKSQQKKQKDLEKFEKTKRETLAKTLQDEKKNHLKTLQQIEENLSKETGIKDRNSEEYQKILAQVLDDEKKSYEQKTQDIINLAEEEITERRTALEEETAEIKAQYDERVLALQSQLQEEKDFLTKHQEELAKVKDRIVLDEIEKAKQRHQESLTRLEEQKQKSISGANASSSNYAMRQNEDTAKLIEESKKRIAQLEAENKVVEDAKKSLKDTVIGFGVDAMTELSRQAENIKKTFEVSMKAASMAGIGLLKEMVNKQIIDPLNNLFKNDVIKGLNGGKNFEISRLAIGTNYFKGGMARVGENGPENVILPKGSKVMPASQSGSGKEITINNYFPPQTDYNLFASRTSYLLDRI
jgi:tape measure domain-containing protein